MTLAALVDAGADLAAIQAGVQSLGLPGVKLVAAEVHRKGFRGLKIDVQHEPEHKHRHLHHITEMIDAGRLTPRAKELAKKIFTRLGEAEAKVHGVEIRKVHFHEVGAIDSIADIVGTAIGLDLLGIERIEASPVPTGCGFINIAHGRCSIPAPATGELLKGIPIAPSNVEAELTTPTGAAILAALGAAFGPPPAMTVQQIGYGAGTRDFESHPNLLRILVGDASSSSGRHRNPVSAGNQSRRRQRRSDRLLFHEIVRIRRAGRVHHQHPNEKESSRRAIGRAMSARRYRSSGNNHLS